MHKVEQIKNLFDCDICDKLLIDPIVLPCGNVVCNSIADRLSEKWNMFSDNCGCDLSSSSRMCLWWLW